MNNRLNHSLKNLLKQKKLKALLKESKANTCYLKKTKFLMLDLMKVLL